MSSPLYGSEEVREAEICARVIRAWHVTIGAALAPTRMRDRPEALRTYRETLARFADADLNRPASQAELARTQLSGVFESFYGEEIPPALWHEYHSELRSDPPVRLNDAARRILHLQEAAAHTEHHDAPRTEESTPAPRASEDRARILFSSPEAVLAAARRHYAAYTSEEDLGIGGANFLLSCSLERSPHLGAADVVLLPGPETLGLTIDASETDHFLRRVRAGELRIEHVEGN